MKLEDATPPWDTPTDDSGAGTDGTVFDSTYWTNQRDAIDNLLHSLLNPTMTPALAIDELVAARGGEADLDTRLDIMDGLIAAAGSTTNDLNKMVGAQNLLANDDFLVWPVVNGAPAYWTKTGAGAISRQTGVAGFAARIGPDAAETRLTQKLISASSISGGAYAGLRETSQMISFGCWVTAAAAGARLVIDDGISQAAVEHNGNGAPQWLTVQKTLSASASKIECYLSNNNVANDADFSGATACFSSVAPGNWIPSPRRYVELLFCHRGNAVAETEAFQYLPARPGIVLDVWLIVKTAPTGANIQVDVNTIDAASARTTMFAAAKPTITATNFQGTAQPNGTYERACFGGRVPGAAVEGSIVTVDIDTVGSGTPGANLVVNIRYLSYNKALEGAITADDI